MIRTRPATPKRSTPARQRGVALIAVLWVSIVLALLAGQVTRLSRSDLDLARNLLEGTRAELAANSALWTAVYIILDGGPEAWRTDGTVYAWRIGEAEVRVRVTDEFGRIDVNAAIPPLLASLFRAAGVETEEATALAEAVAAFRKQDTEEHVGRRAARPRDRLGVPFAAIEALYQVPGMPPGLVDRVRPALTVHTGKGWPEEESALPLVLAAMEERVLLEEAAGDGSGGELPPATDDVQSLKESPAVLREPENPRVIHADIMRIEAEAVTGAGFHFAREAVVSFGSRPGAPWEFRLWRRGHPVLFPAPTERH